MPEPAHRARPRPPATASAAAPAAARVAASSAGAALPATRLVLHGDACVRLPDGQVVLLERRAAALCALAALQPGIARERAAAWLWPDSADPRRNLRQQLLRFRQQFGQPLIEGGAQLLLAPDVVLSEAEGELLAGQVCDDDDFGAWLAAQRTAAAAARRSSWQRALASAEAAGELDAALLLAERAVATDTDNEDAWQALMRVHCLRGEAARGLAAYDRLVQMLAQQHGRKPTAATADLAQALLRGLPAAAEALPLALHATVALPVTLKRPPRLVGRASEMAAVRQAWAEGCAVLLQAEAGMGKSRLIAELAGPGALIGTGRPGDANAPYASLARWLAPLLNGDLGRLAAAHRQALGHLTVGSATGPALQRGALDAAVAALLQRQRVRCLVLDDLHHADAATLELAAGLATSAQPSTRWLFATRPVENSPAAMALRDGLLENQRLRVVTLAPLDEAATVELVDALALRGLNGTQLAAALARHTGGNPLYLLETLKQGLQDGSLARGLLPRPVQVSALLDRRLQHLSEPALSLARVAAIAGVDFSIELAEAATGQRAVMLATAWQELQDAQVLRDEGFAHDLVADAALRSVPPVVARRVHVQCAQWLEAQGVEPARVAWHWRHGGRPAEAGRGFVLAARRAEKAARVEEEAALYQHAADALAEAGLDEERFDALVGRVRALNGAEFDQLAMQECRALLDVATHDAQRLRVHSELCGLLTERSESQAAIETGTTALALARQLADTEWEVRTTCHVASALRRLGRAADAVALLAPLQAWIDAQSEDDLRMLWYGDWGGALGDTGRLRESLAAYEAALAASRRLGMVDAESRLLLNCAVTLRQGGQFDRALALSRQGHALSVVEGDTSSSPINRLVLARDEAEAGQYGQALPALESLQAEFERRGVAFWVQAVRMVLARLWLDLGQYARAVPLLRAEPADLPAWLRADRRLLQLQLAQALAQRPPEAMLDEALALAATDAQRGPLLRVRALRHMSPDQVLAQAQPLVAVLHAHERFGALLGLHTHVARAALAQGQVHTAADAGNALLALFDSGHAPDSMYRAEAWWVAHQALAAAGQAEVSGRALQAGEQWLRQVAMPQVPAAFIDSFLNRNAVNRALLAAAAAL